ncbi:MAG: bifunctional serine/threonine-protein kinase/formylglycine-generating enzyme family protein [Planctomycetota bacterium]
MGTVYKAKKEDGRMFAVKILPPIFSRDTSKVDRFLKEAESSKRLDHPNVVKVHEFGKAGDVHFIAMQLVVGQSVGDLIKNKRAVKIQDSLRIIRETAKGLAFAHSRGIVHRDIKPDNIMLNNDGRIQVADFGLARDVEASSSLSGSGEIVGTPYYISPEQIDCQDVDSRADIYSLGATIYHLITGKRPFEGATPMEVLLKHVNEKLVPPMDRNPLIPVPVSRLISKMMEKNRTFRYQDCEDLVADIELIEEGRDVQILLEEETEPKRKPPPPPVVRRGRARPLLTLLFMIVIGGAAAGIRFGPLPPLEEREFFPRVKTPPSAAELALNEALTYMKRQPEDPLGALNKLLALIDAHPDSPEAAKATEARKVLDGRLDGEALEWVNRQRGMARELMDDGLLGKALLLALGKPPEHLAGRPALSSLEALRTRIAAELAKKQGMVLVPGGEVHGRRAGAQGSREEVSAFLMDITEVSNRRYLEFVKARGARAPWPEGKIPEGQEDWPVTGIDFQEAQAYAEFREKRLPTEEEWELAAAGPEGRPYPWGGDFDHNRARCRPTGAKEPASVLSYAEGRTPLGIHHMAGNVHEWTTSLWQEGSSDRVVRGGGWGSHPFNLRTDSRARIAPGTRHDGLGFRLAKDP